MPFAPPPAASTMFQLSFPMDADAGRALAAKGKAALLDEARRRCGAWAAPLPELLAATHAHDVTGYPVFDRPLDGTRLTPPDGPLAARATLLGDAAHPMTPFKGQGANQALVDAVRLARALYDSTLGDDAAHANADRAGDAECRARRRRHRPRMPIREAIDAYEREAAARAAVKVSASRAAAELLHSPAALAVTDEPLTRAAAARRALRRSRHGSLDENVDA